MVQARFRISAVLKAAGQASATHLGVSRQDSAVVSERANVTQRLASASDPAGRLRRTAAGRAGEPTWTRGARWSKATPLAGLTPSDERCAGSPCHAAQPVRTSEQMAMPVRQSRRWGLICLILYGGRLAPLRLVGL